MAYQVKAYLVISDNQAREIGVPARTPLSIMFPDSQPPSYGVALVDPYGGRLYRSTFQILRVAHRARIETNDPRFVRTILSLSPDTPGIDPIRDN